MIGWLVAAVIALWGWPAAAAVNQAAVERAFQTWLTADLWPRAQTAGVSRPIFDRAIKGITLDWSLPDLQPPGEPVKQAEVEWQAEFRSPASYFDEGGLQRLAKQGRALIAKWRSTLDKIEAKYGVPAEILVAIWGRESDYGTDRLPGGAIRTLATEAFMGRRSDLFREELVAGLRILERGDISPERMRSSWAGGLGQPQFQPRLFEAYAVDFDGDGKRDIWDSIPDTLASIANFLAGEGWQRGLTTALEVKLPASVTCATEGPPAARPVADWTKLGLLPADGRALPATADAATFLLLPAGRDGPVFLATQNFNVIKQYNRSDLYALYIAHLADRFADDRPFRGAWTDVGHFTRGDVRALQERLAALGRDVGTADGLVGYRTRVAVGQAQEQFSLPVTCLPTPALLQRLG